MSRRITTLNDGETPLSRYMVDGLDVTQLPDDPLALRISLGEAPGGLAYLVYRGSRERMVALLRRALRALDDA